MKQIKLLACIALAVFAWACEPELVPSLELKSSDAVSVPVDGDVVSIKFTTNIPWTAKSSESWVTVSPASGEGQEGEITVKASATKNETNDSRSATVTIEAGTLSKVVTITQGQMDALVVPTAEYTVSCDGGNVYIPVSANVQFDVIIPEAVDWIHPGTSVPSSKAMTETNVSVYVDKTQMYAFEEDWSIDPNRVVRSANITIKSGALEQVVKINQTTFSPYFDYQGDWAGLQWSFYEGAPTVIPQEGADITIDINTNLEWRAFFSVWDNDLGQMVDSWDLGWAHLSYDANKIHLVIDANDNYFPREDYLYSECLVDGEVSGDFGGLGWFKQDGLVAEGAVATLDWQVNFADLGIIPTYNRLAYTATGALLVSDGAKVHAINPADGAYWKAITYPGIAPVSIDSDDAGNIIVAEDVVADIDWNTYELLSGTSVKIWYSDNPNELTNFIVAENKDYGTVGGFRVRGNLADKAVITGVVGSASCWFGYDIENYATVANYYGTQNQGPGPGPNPFWNPQSAAAVSVGNSLHDGVLFRGYDGLESLCYLAEAYTPQWAAPEKYIWTTLSEGGNGGNENQNNLDIVDFNGKRIVAYTNGFHFDYSANAMIYILDVTDLANVQTLGTIDAATWLLDTAWSGSNSADVLLHPAGDHLELYAIQSGKNTLARFSIIIP